MQLGEMPHFIIRHMLSKRIGEMQPCEIYHSLFYDYTIELNTSTTIFNNTYIYILIGECAFRNMAYFHMWLVFLIIK